MVEGFQGFTLEILVSKKVLKRCQDEGKIYHKTDDIQCHCPHHHPHPEPHLYQSRGARYNLNFYYSYLTQHSLHLLISTPTPTSPQARLTTHRSQGWACGRTQGTNRGPTSDLEHNSASGLTFQIGARSQKVGRNRYRNRVAKVQL